MVDDFAETFDECPLNQAVSFTYIWEHENCSLFGVAVFPLFWCIKVYAGTIGTCTIVHCIMGVCGVPQSQLTVNTQGLISCIGYSNDHPCTT